MPAPVGSRAVTPNPAPAAGPHPPEEQERGTHFRATPAPRRPRGEAARAAGPPHGPNPTAHFAGVVEASYALSHARTQPSAAHRPPPRLATVAALAATPGVAQARSGHGSYIVLAPGDHGSRVARLQRYLHVRPASGYYGRVTRARRRWQATHHRNRTGLVGKLLWRNVIGAAHTSRSAPGTVPLG